MLVTSKAIIKVVGALGDRVSALGPLLLCDPCRSTQDWTSIRSGSVKVGSVCVPHLAKKKAGALLCSAGLRSSHGSELKAPPSRAGRPVLSDPEEGARPALVRGAPSPARRAGQPAGSAPSIGPRGPGRAAPPPHRLLFAFN